MGCECLAAGTSLPICEQPLVFTGPEELKHVAMKPIYKRLFKFSKAVCLGYFFSFDSLITKQSTSQSPFLLFLVSLYVLGSKEQLFLFCVLVLWHSSAMYYLYRSERHWQQPNSNWLTELSLQDWQTKGLIPHATHCWHQPPCQTLGPPSPLDHISARGVLQTGSQTKILLTYLCFPSLEPVDTAKVVG